MRRSAAAAVLVLAVLGCRGPMASLASLGVRLPPQRVEGDPFSRQPAALERLWDMDWWARLVPYESWVYQPREPASPSLDPETGRVFLATRDGRIHALNKDGTAAWELAVKGPFEAGPTVKDGVVYAASAKGILYALRAGSGEKLWEYDAKEGLATEPVVEQQLVLVASLSDTVYAVDRKTGKWVWQHRRDLPAGFTIHGASRPVVSAGTVYRGFADGTLVALSAADGTLKWEHALAERGDFRDVDTAPAVDEESGRLYAASYGTGVVALDTANGKELWRSAEPGIVSLLLDRGVLYASGDQGVRAYRAEDGTTMWTRALGERAGRRAILARGLLVVPLSTSLLFLEPASGRTRAEWDPGEGVTATPLWTGTRLVVLSNDGFVYAMSLPVRRE